MKIMELNQGTMQINSVGRCKGDMKHKAVIKNNLIEIEHYDSNFAPLIYLVGPGNYTIEGNYFKNFQQPSPRGIFELSNRASCV